MSIATFDIETDALDLDKITRIHCAAVKDHETGIIRSFIPSTVQELPETLSKYEILIGHNSIAFDLPVLKRMFRYIYRGRIIDTLLMSRLQRPNRIGGHSVEAWGKTLGREKIRHEQWDKFSEDMLRRCIEDTEIQYLIYQALLDEGKDEGWERAHRLNFQLYTYLRRQEEYGWCVDKHHMERCIRQLTRWVERIDKAISPRLPIIMEKGSEFSKPFCKDGSYSKIAEKWQSETRNEGKVAGPFTRVDFRRIDLDKPLEVKQFLLNEGWKPKEWNVDKDGNRTSPKLNKDDDFEGIKGKLGRVVAKRFQCKQRKGTIEGLYNSINTKGRISSTVGGMAKTGRLRHSTIVNIPSPHSNSFYARQMRQIFIASPGMVMVGVDSKGNQIRQLAARMNDDEFTKAVLSGRSESGTDIHSINQKRAGLHSRTLAKNLLYGTIFGASDAKIGRVTGKGKAEGKRLREALFKGMPGLQSLIQKLTAEWRATAKKIWNKQWQRWEYYDGWIKGLDGRPIQIEKEHTILVYLLQSDEAIQMAAAYCWFQVQMDKKYEYGKDYGMLIWMHDEYQFECIPEISREAALLAEESISWAGKHFNIRCPHEGESKIGNNWYETH